MYYYGLIPERVYQITCATSNKRRIKQYTNHFGSFIYRDIPIDAYPYGIIRNEENGYCYYMATKEKAICDMLYTYSPVYSVKEIEKILFDDLRIDDDNFSLLDMKLMVDIASLYRSTNHKLLISLVRRKYYD